MLKLLYKSGCQCAPVHTCQWPDHRFPFPLIRWSLQFNLIQINSDIQQRTQHPTPGHYAARPVTGQGSQNKHWLFHSFRAIKLTSCVGTSECNESLTLWRCCVAIVLPLFPLFRSRKLQTRPCGAAALMQPLSYCYIISEISDHKNREHFQEFRLATKKNIKQRSVPPFLAEFK